ncbi:MAG: hypothetical protein J0I40_08445 [Cellulomonas sp.]|uniref:hypothetical protein n=1 Tax=Cellulomonas sp. 73-92 TaxID=1895740 RepID=UPI000AC5C31C|nr:hypothetical protein [Cellulomonas sp. 73-92]MBN9375401.1 hypothetical protein [Cellulomonas sp.]
MKIYVASSWRNARQPQVVDMLTRAGHEAYDFRNPPGATGFAWHEVGLATDRQTLGGHDTVPTLDFLDAMDHPRAHAAFGSDFAAMHWADACVLVTPCGRSAHLELGWAVGAGKRTAVLLDHHVTPELMYGMVDHLTVSEPELLAWLADIEAFGG